MRKFLKRYLLWLFYNPLFFAAILFGASAPLFVTESEYVSGKYVLLTIFFGFLGYSLYATKRQIFFLEPLGSDPSFLCKALKTSDPEFLMHPPTEQVARSVDHTAGCTWF